MKTKKPISTISYNTKEFLVLLFSKLVKDRVIANFYAIYHHAEADEKSDHWHIYLEPNGQIDTMVLETMFNEFDPKHPDKPFRCRPFKFTKVDIEYHPDEWLLYAVHDPVYLESKGQSRKYIYDWEEILCRDKDQLIHDMYHAKFQSDVMIEKMRREEIKEARSVSDLYYSGRIPPQMITAMIALKKDEANQQELNRNGRVTHTPLFRPRQDPRHLI